MDTRGMSSDPSPPYIEPRVTPDAPRGHERELAFTDAPPIVLTRIDQWAPDPDDRWPPVTSKSSGRLIWRSQIVVGPRGYGQPSSAGWVHQDLDLAPERTTIPLGRADERLQLLGLAGDLLVYARAIGRGSTKVELLTALDDGDDEPTVLCELDWPWWAVSGELSVWQERVGPVLAGDEVVMLASGSLVHVSPLDGEVGRLWLDHEPRGLAVGDRRAAWLGTHQGQAGILAAFDDFSRTAFVSRTGKFEWAGDSLIIVTDDAEALRWTPAEDALVASILDPPLPLQPSDGWTWDAETYLFGDGEVAWVFAQDRPLWRFDAAGFVGLAIAMPWPDDAVAGAGALIWEVAQTEPIALMEIWSTAPGWGLGLDRELLGGAASRR
jgi:hypothetical protein